MSSLDDARGQFTDVQNRKITELFHSIDLDDSGALDKPEIVVVLGGDADRMMAKLDTDPDDMVTLDEWVDYMGAVKRDRGDAFLNSIIRFWENRVADAIEAAENDKKLGVKDLTTEQIGRLKALWGVADSARTALVDLGLLVVGFGGDMANLLAECQLEIDGKVLYKSWHQWWAGLKSERGNSFVEAVLEVMERRVQEAAAGGPGSPKHSSPDKPPSPSRRRQNAGNRLSAVQRKKATALFTELCTAINVTDGAISVDQLLIAQGGQDDALFNYLVEAGSEAGGQLTNDEWLEYLLNIKKQSGEVHMSYVVRFLERNIKKVTANSPASEPQKWQDNLAWLWQHLVPAGGACELSSLEAVHPYAQVGVGEQLGLAGTIAEQDVQTALQQLGSSKGQLWVEHTVKYWCRHAHVQIHAAQEAAALEARDVSLLKQTQLSEAAAARATEVYQSVDVDGTGLVDKLDVLASPGFGTDDAAKLLARLDPGEDGLITLDEFVMFLVVLKVEHSTDGDESKGDEFVTELLGLAAQNIQQANQASAAASAAAPASALPAASSDFPEDYLTPRMSDKPYRIQSSAGQGNSCLPERRTACILVFAILIIFSLDIAALMGRGWCTSSTFDAGLWESDVKVGGVKTLADNQGGQKDTGETVGGCLIAAIIMLGIAAGMMMFRLVGSTCNSTARCWLTATAVFIILGFFLTTASWATYVAAGGGDVDGTDDSVKDFTSCDYDWSLAVVVVGWLLLFVITIISAFLAAPHWKEDTADHNDIELSSNAISRADTHNIESSDDKTEGVSKAADDGSDVKYNPPAPHEPNSPVHRSKQDNRV